MTDNREVNRKAAVVVATVFAYSLIGVLLLRFGKDPEALPTPTPTPTQDEARMTEAIQRGISQSRVTIQKTVVQLVGGVSCDQYPVGNSVTVRLNAKRDFYDPGEYLLRDSKPALVLAQGIKEVYRAFEDVKTNEFTIDFSPVGTADSMPIKNGIVYEGKLFSCFVGGRTRWLEPGSRLDNELLSCARAAALTEDLASGITFPRINLQGREHGERGGQYRSVDVEILFKGLLLYAPDVDFCGS